MDEIELSVVEVTEVGLTPDPIPRARYGLVVDDNALVTDTLAAILRDNGYTVSTAYDGEEALQLALLAPPDFVISDVFMPRLSGVELAARLGKLMPDCCILLISGQPDDARELASAISPAVKYTLLAKPLQPERILQELAKVQQ